MCGKGFCWDFITRKELEDAGRKLTSLAVYQRGVKVLQMEITREGKRKDKKGQRDTQGGRELEGWAPESREAPGLGGRARSLGPLIWVPLLVTFPMWLRLLPAEWPCSEWAYPKREHWR